MYKKTTLLMKTFAAVSIGLIGLSTAALSEEEHHEVHESHHEGHEWELGVSVGYANLKR